MRFAFIRKLFVVLIIAAPVFTDLACKKQPKCGCGKDVVFEMINQSVNVYYDVANNGASFTNPIDQYSSYSFCNAKEMMSTLSKYRSGSLLLLTGKAYYECNYLMNAGNNPYYAQYKVFLVEVSDVREILYGK